MFDAITSTYQDRRSVSGIAASAGLHLALIGLAFTVSRLLLPAAPASQPVLAFPSLPHVLFKNPTPAHALTTAPPAHSVTHHALKPVLDKPATPTPRVADAPSDAALGTDTAPGLGTGPAGTGIDTGIDTGPATGVSGGTSEAYVRVSHAPHRLSGAEEPNIPASMLMQLRGSHAVVLAKIQISARGEVEDVTIVNSTAPQLDDVIRRHIANSWRFEAPTSGGRPTAVQYLQSFRFSF